MATRTDRGPMDDKNGTFEKRRRTDPSADYDPAELESAVSTFEPREVIAQVESFARANPHLALAGAAAIGFVLGGGLTPRLVGAVGMIAARRYLSGTMKETLGSLLEGV